MNRTARILVAAAVLMLLVTATAIGAPSDRGQERRAPVASSHEPQTPEDVETADEPEDEAPSQAKLEELATRLNATPEEIAALAEVYGLGGAVRILAWADAAPNHEASDITALFDSGMGWGQIAKQLNEEDPELDLHPGIGQIMGNGRGHGRENAPGQQKKP